MPAQVSLLSRTAFFGEIPRDIHEDARDVARRRMSTKAFLKSRDERKRVEMRFAHLKTHHGSAPQPATARAGLRVSCVALLGGVSVDASAPWGRRQKIQIRQRLPQSSITELRRPRRRLFRQRRPKPVLAASRAVRQFVPR